MKDTLFFLQAARNGKRNGQKVQILPEVDNDDVDNDVIERLRKAVKIICNFYFYRSCSCGRI